MHPRGKGYFIWHIERTAGGDPAAVLAMCQAAKIDYVLVKITNGTYAYPTEPIRGLIDVLVPAGIGVWGWTYSYGINILMKDQSLAEVEILVQQFHKLPELKGIVVNAEKEYKRIGGAKAALSYSTALRARLPGVSIGFCSYRWPSRHGDFPWSKFLPVMDFHMGQVYWVGDHNPAAQLRQSVAELKALRDVPQVPVGPAYKEGTWLGPTRGELREFAAAVHTLDLPGVCYWAWEHAQNNEVWWNEIASDEWNLHPPTEFDLWMRKPELERWRDLYDSR